MMAVGGLLVAIIIAGLIGFWQTRNIERVSAEALGYVELEDEGDDIRAAILDVRHYHRNLYFNSLNTGRLTREGIEEYGAARTRLYEEIDELGAVDAYDPDTPQPEDFRRWADEYYATFGPFTRKRRSPTKRPSTGPATGASRRSSRWSRGGEARRAGREPDGRLAAEGGPGREDLGVRAARGRYSACCWRARPSPTRRCAW
jgi:hypothetical protein